MKHTIRAVTRHGEFEVNMQKKRLRRAAFYQDLGNPDPYLEEV
jgi:hypothetical protein